MNYYECHITMEADAEKIKPMVEDLKWKFSSIHGDTVFGDTVKCYATRQFPGGMAEPLVFDTLISIADKLAHHGAKVLRRKIERVIYDDRSSKVRIDDEAPGQDSNSSDRADQGTQQPTMDAVTEDCDGE